MLTEQAKQTAQTEAEEPWRKVMLEVTENLTQNLREVLSAALEKQLTESLTQSLLESEFYRRISEDMRSGLRRMYSEMTVATDISAETSNLSLDKSESDKLFQDASEQLSAVLEQTEQATVTIMETIEKHMDLQAENDELLQKARAGAPDWERMTAINQTFMDDSISMMTTLSFQDLTGQRIKKVVSAMRQLEATVLELYLSSGLLMKGYEQGKDIADLEQNTRQSVAKLRQQVESEGLKGPSKDGNSQNDIDDLLAQFGL